MARCAPRRGRAVTGVLLALAGAALAPACPARTAQEAPKIVDQPAWLLLHQLRTGAISSRDLVRAYLARIARLDRAGPTLRSILATNPQAMTQARASDRRREGGLGMPALLGLPVIVKDNIETADAMPTTAGSLALRHNAAHRDASVIARLKAQGALVLAKANLSEWANFRASRAVAGWSALGGRVRNPYALDHTACGSSAGTAAAVAASFGAVGIGTETDGSITCPAAMNGLVGLKPTVGLVSRSGIIPISRSQDTAGPMGRNVRDVALLFSAMVASDPDDPVTQDADRYRDDIAAPLSAQSLKGVRIGVLRPVMSPAMRQCYDAALADLRKAGAVLVDVPLPRTDGIAEAEFVVLRYEFKAGINAYLASTPDAVETRNLTALIAFNRAHADRELALFGQDLLEQADQSGGLDDQAYLSARETSSTLARRALDDLINGHDLRLIVQPTEGPAWTVGPDKTDHPEGESAAMLPAVAGYPHLTVPMGRVHGLPVGLSFIGPRFTDARLLSYGYAFEQRQPRRSGPHVETIRADR